MAKDYKNELATMERLINFGLTESKKTTDTRGIVEYSQLGADGNTYGILREGTKYYVKVAPKKDTKIVAEDFDYVGGFNNRKSYDSYTKASQALNFKLMSVNEAAEEKKPVQSQFAINESAEWQNAQTKEARQELNRFYQLVNNVDNILSENVHYIKEEKDGPFTEKPSKKDGGGHKGNVGSQQKLGITDKTFVHGAKNVNPESVYDKNGVKGNSPSGKYDAACGDHDIDENGGNPYQNKAKKGMNEAEVLAWRDDRAFVHNSSDSELDRSHGTEIGDTAPFTNKVNEEENDWGSEGLPGKPGIGDPKQYKEPFTNNTKQPMSEEFVFEVEMDGPEMNVEDNADMPTDDGGLNEGTTLNLFGDHPAYQKVVMSLPKTGDSSQWGRDWNDDSTKSEKPYGEKIGSSSPYDDIVDKIADALVTELGKKKD